MTSDLLVLGALWCFAVFCFGFGWIMGHASALGRHADKVVERFWVDLSEKRDDRLW